ncbi:hypothetical protein HMPREF0766_13298 [Sphingobacterium spiritivorum ATCC 33861]|uniref:Uncharacterized protein n=1 Tax=Sphingobacterium spiritivorum ATCC 33861 TaxID=525373 RepID=D7VQP4_SPHSI|nr:hypothetical protein HMPREF0766_13298 [Sphingobacterium spiritivorum ATCC 33861]
MDKNDRFKSFLCHIFAALYEEDNWEEGNITSNIEFIFRNQYFEV